MFINLEKTYNRVPREVLWRCMESRGIPVSYIRYIKDIYDWAKILIRTVGDDS